HKKPNILLIIADDLSKTLPLYGDSTITTPGMDVLAKDGVVFERAYCTASSCTPSRASILTGRYPHQLTQGGNLHGTLPLKYENYALILADNGYRVGLQGKGWGQGTSGKGRIPKILRANPTKILKISCRISPMVRLSA